MSHRIENEGQTLQNLLFKVQDDAQKQADFTVPTDQVLYRSYDRGDSVQSEIVLEAEKGEPTRHLTLNGVAFDQIARDAEIDVRTARRLRSGYREQWDNLVNAIWQREPTLRILRTHMHGDTHGVARAWVSNKFKIFDHHDMLQAVLPSLMESDAEWKIVNADVTDRRMYARFKSEIITGEGANVGDTMALGLGISNSETGHGSVSVFQINWTLACLNGMQTENRSRKSHITTARGDSETWGILSSEAKNADNKALALQMRDISREYSSRESFDAVLEKMKSAAQDILEGSNAKAACDKLGQVLKIPQKNHENLFNGLLQTIGQSGYNDQRPISRATLLNAVTACAHDSHADQVDYWQGLGGQVLNLSEGKWRDINKASVTA